MIDALIPCEPLRVVLDEFMALHPTANAGWDVLAERMGYADGHSASGSIPVVLRGEHVTSGRSDFDAYDWTDRLLTAVGATQLWPRLVDLSADEVELHDSTCADCRKSIDWDDPADLAVRIEMGELVNVRRRWSWWTLCAVCFAETGFRAETRPDVCGKFARRIPDEDLLNLYRAYVTGRVGVEHLVEDLEVWETYGYATPVAAARSIEKVWDQWGWPRFDRRTARLLNAGHRRASGEIGGRIPAADLRRLHTLHRKGKGLSIRELARRVHTQYGYKTAHSCAAAISENWKQLGLRARDRIEMCREASAPDGLVARERHRQAGTTVHDGLPYQQRCLGTTTRKTRCQRQALMGEVYCYNHHPLRALQRAAIGRRQSVRLRTEHLHKQLPDLLAA